MVGEFDPFEDDLFGATAAFVGATGEGEAAALGVVALLLDAVEVLATGAGVELLAAPAVEVVAGELFN